MNFKKLSDNKNMSFVAFFNILSPIVLNGINFFTIPIFTRMLGTENYGVVSIYTTWLAVLTCVMSLQTQGTIGTACVHIPEEKHNEYFSSAVSLSLLSSIIISVLMIIFINPISEFFRLSPMIIILMLLQSIATFGINFATTKFIYYKQAHKNFAVSVITAISGVVFSLLFIIMTSDFSQKYQGKILGSALPTIIIGGVLIYFILANGKKFYSREYWKFCLTLSIPLIFHTLTNIILGQSDKVMLQQFTDDSTVGIYGFVFTFTQILHVIWLALNNTWVPYYYDYMKKGETEIINAKTKNYMYLFTSLILGFIFVSPEVVKLFSSQDFWGGISIIPILSLSIYFTFFYSFSVNVQFFYKKTVAIAVGTVSSAVCNIVLNFILIPSMGIMGAALSTLISHILLFVFHTIIAKTVLKDKCNLNIKMFLPGLIAVSAGTAIYYLLVDMFILRWIFAIAIGLLLVRRIYKQKSIF